MAKAALLARPGRRDSAYRGFLGLGLPSSLRQHHLVWSDRTIHFTPGQCGIRLDLNQNVEAHWGGQTDVRWRIVAHPSLSLPRMATREQKERIELLQGH